MDVNGVMPPNSGSNILTTTHVCMFIYCIHFYNVQEEIKDARDLWNTIQYLARSSNFYCWLFILFQSSLFDEFDLRNLQTSFHPIERCQIRESFWTHSQALALQQSWVFVFRLVFSKWKWNHFHGKVHPNLPPLKVCVEPPKKQTIHWGGEKAIPFCCLRHGWRHWRREGWDFVDGIQGVIKATHLDKRRRFFTMISGLRSGSFFLLKDLRIPKRWSVFGFQHFRRADFFFSGPLNRVSVAAPRCFFWEDFKMGPTYQKLKEPEFDLMNPAHRCR